MAEADEKKYIRISEAAKRHSHISIRAVCYIYNSYNERRR